MSDNKIRTITKDGITYDIEDSRVGDLSSQVNQNTDNISSLNGDIQNLDNRITVIETTPSSHCYLHTVRISAWDDTVPGGMRCDDIEFCFKNNIATPYDQSTFIAYIATSAGYNTVAWCPCPTWMYGSEDSYYYSSTLADISWNNSEKCFKATLYNHSWSNQEIHPVLKNANGFNFEDTVVQLW